MKKLFFCLMLVSISASARDWVGTYRSSTSCYGNFSALKIEQRTPSELFVFARSPEGAWVVSETFDLESEGKTFDCTPHASYGRVQCQVKTSETSLLLRRRGCMLLCGPWHVQLSIKAFGPEQITVTTSEFAPEPCIMTKTSN